MDIDKMKQDYEKVREENVKLKKQIEEVRKEVANISYLRSKKPRLTTDLHKANMTHLLSLHFLLAVVI